MASLEAGKSKTTLGEQFSEYTTKKGEIAGMDEIFFINNCYMIFYLCFADRFPFAPNQDVILPDWEVYIRDTANEIIKEQTPQKLFAVRERVYELLSHLVPPQLLFEVSKSLHFQYFPCFTCIHV